MKIKNKFYCNCDFHYIDVNVKSIGDVACVDMTIYQHRSEDTGKLFKKPKELGTVVLIGKEALEFKRKILTTTGKE